jgi:GAF domain-containing protein
MTGDKPKCYRDLAGQLASLLEGEADRIANAANMTALIRHGLPDLNWAGFYFRRGSELVLGPFQGQPACLRIPVGAGVCGTAAARGVSILVPDVDDFPGHIACDPQSRSELVVPLIEDGAVAGVLDLDSPLAARFDEADRVGCERLVALFVAHHRRTPVENDGTEPRSGCRLPLPRRDDLDAAGQAIDDELADRAGGRLEGPPGIRLHSPELSRLTRAVDDYLRYRSGLGDRVRELAILATARELGDAVAWEAHEPMALEAGIAREIIDIVQSRADTGGLAEPDAVVIELGRGIFAARRVGPLIFARALRRFGRGKLVDLVALMGSCAATAALRVAFDMPLDPDRPAPSSQ